MARRRGSRFGSPGLLASPRRREVDRRSRAGGSHEPTGRMRRSRAEAVCGRKPPPLESYT